MNKLNAIVLGSLLSVSALSAVNAAETTASATWQATATKDSESDLVVTPTRALNFVYSPIPNLSTPIPVCLMWLSVAITLRRPASNSKLSSTIQTTRCSAWAVKRPS
ncbi:common pilus major fimbrillin subunit EcpA [Enterobacter hormaechei]|uniref:common pilus major fimbrillin subunit EcpA n=1 Tax=Enterobacter hormaechei TaxID=158836 RepID=UPI0039C29E9B